MTSPATTANDWKDGKSMDFDQIVDEVKARSADLGELNHTVLFDLEDAGKILVDATGDDVVVKANPDDDEAETTLVLSPENLQKLMAGELNPMVAFTMGKLKVFGSKGIALKLSSLLDQAG
jgi:putative sterol carrier protein